MKEPERVAVLGLGDFGYHLACELYQLGHEVLAVDSNQDKVQQILPYVTKAVVADASDQAALQELGVVSFDLVAVYMGERLETAVVLVHHLHQWKLPRILVKVTNEEQAEIVKLVGATDVIHPEQDSARKAALLIHHSRAVDYLELGGEHLIVAAQPPASVVGKTVGTMAFQERHGVALLGLWHAGQQGPPLPPAPDRTIAETDVLILAGHIDRLRALRRMQ